MSDDLPECRICFDIETDDDVFISPCMCKGTSKYIHKNCLNTWRNFNRDTVAWSKCMECGAPYTIRFKYPMESLTIFPMSKNASMFCFLQYMSTLVGGSIIWILEVNDGYLAIRMLNFNQTLSKPSVLDYVKENDLFPQIFYFSYTMFLQSLCFYLYFFYKSYNNINRKKLYFRKIRNTGVISLLFTIQFLAWYYICVFNDLPVIFLNIVCFISILEPFLHYNIIKKHHEIINIMNGVENNTEILSYAENPLNGHENILRQFELRNIVIEN